MSETPSPRRSARDRAIERALHLASAELSSLEVAGAGERLARQSARMLRSLEQDRPTARSLARELRATRSALADLARAISEVAQVAMAEPKAAAERPLERIPITPGPAAARAPVRRRRASARGRSAPRRASGRTPPPP